MAGNFTLVSYYSKIDFYLLFLSFSLRLLLRGMLAILLTVGGADGCKLTSLAFSMNFIFYFDLFDLSLPSLDLSSFFFYLEPLFYRFMEGGLLSFLDVLGGRGAILIHL